MSGPKTSSYTLTPEQRRILEEQRRRDIEKEILTKNKGNIRSVIAQAERIILKIEPFYTVADADASALTKAKKLYEAAKDALKQASSVSDKEGSESLKRLNQSISKVSRELTEAVNKADAEYSHAEKAFQAEMSECIDEGFDVSFSYVGEADSVDSGVFEKKIQSVLDSLSALSISDEQRARMDAISAKFAEIDDPDFQKNFYTMTVTPFAKECQAYHNAYTAYGEEYERKLFIYEANARKIGITAESIPFSADVITVLDARIKETEEIIRYQEEQAYISRCVDEAMREMGYCVVGDREVVRRNGKRFRNELYLFDEGTAVNVTYSDDGQITMELGGIGVDDRLPTEAESTSLASDMRTFCDDYHEIEKILMKKGIVAKRISVLPPDAQYAQIINVSDYNMSTEVSEYQAKTTKKNVTENKANKIGG